MLTAAVCSSSSVPRTWAEAAPGQARGHQQGADVQTHKVPSPGLHFPICEMGCYRERVRSKWPPWGCKQHMCCQDRSLHPWATALASAAYSQESSSTRHSSAISAPRIPALWLWDRLENPPRAVAAWALLISLPTPYKAPRAGAVQRVCGGSVRCSVTEFFPKKEPTVSAMPGGC